MTNNFIFGFHSLVLCQTYQIPTSASMDGPVDGIGDFLLFTKEELHFKSLPSTTLISPQNNPYV
jgi:hypothetical protein